MAHDTAPIRPEERFEEAVVAEYLLAALPEFLGDGPVHFEQFPGGAANLTYLARAGDVELVLRRAPLGEVAQRAHDMSREYRVLSRLWSKYPRAPRAYHFCEDASVMGKPFFVMERRHGYVIRNEWPPQFGDNARLRLAVGLVESLAELHLVDPAAVDLGDLGHPEGFVARQIDGWAQRWEAAKTREVPAMELAAAALRDALPDPQAATILHNDFKLDNTMTSTEGDLVAVFDWDMTTRGDPLVDVGTFLAYWADPNSPADPVFGERAVTLAPILSKDEIKARYGDATGFDLTDIAYYEGLALYRIAVIIEQIYARYVAGQTMDARFAAFEPLAPLLAGAALDVLTS